MDLVRDVLTAELLDPETGRRTTTAVEVRLDPLTGHTARILPPRGLMPANEFDLEAFAEQTRTGCPFCPERIDTTTPRLPPELDARGRITHGEAVLFPNLHAYASHSSVSVYSPELHHLPLEEMTERLLSDNLLAQIEYLRAVTALAPDAVWASINANHMLPAGSSLFHPHLQGIVDPHPSTMQRLLAATPAARFDAYLETERRAGERHLANTGRVDWVASFAPLAPAEVRAFIPGVSSPAECDADLAAEVADGLVRTLHGYADMGFQSFNLALYGAPAGTPGYPLNLRVACRSNLRPHYRSDSTFLERLHWEAAIDLCPEAVAERIRERFRR